MPRFPRSFSSSSSWNIPFTVPISQHTILLPTDAEISAQFQQFLLVKYSVHHSHSLLLPILGILHPETRHYPSALLAPEIVNQNYFLVQNLLHYSIWDLYTCALLFKTNLFLSKFYTLVQNFYCNMCN